MYIARMLFPVKNLGPGERIGIWVSGCLKNCKGCANPELHARESGQDISIDMLEKLIGTMPKTPSALTVTGGEPFEQAKELAELCEWFTQKYGDDILVYTGYTIEQLRSRHNLATDAVLNSIAALVDGEYIEQLNNGNKIKGSDNQRLFVLRKEYADDYCALDTTSDDQRVIQLFPTGDGGVITTGFERRGFKEHFSANLKQKPKGGE